MTTGKLSSHWPGIDDRSIVPEMVSNPTSKHWDECLEYVKMRVQIQAKNIPLDRWDDIVQEAMLRIHRYLPTFHFNCKLVTWIYGIIRSCVIDEYRDAPRDGIHFMPLTGFQDENEDEAFTAHSLGPEDMNILLEELHDALAALEEYLSEHSDPQRNRQILEMVLIDGQSREEAAKAVGCSGPVASHVVRAAQEHVRKKLEHQKPQRNRKVQ